MQNCDQSLHLRVTKISHHLYSLLLLQRIAHLDTPQTHFWVRRILQLLQSFPLLQKSSFAAINFTQEEFDMQLRPPAAILKRKEIFLSMTKTSQKPVWLILLTLQITQLVWSKPAPESSLSSLAPGPFGTLDNLKPPRALSDNDKVSFFNLCPKQREST